MLSKRLIAFTLAGSLASGGCGLDAELFGAALDQGHVVLPQPSDTVLSGFSTPAADGLVAFTTGSGVELAGRQSDVGSDGAFAVRFGGGESYAGLVVWASRGDRVIAGVLPEIPRQPSVFYEERRIDLWQPPYGHPSLGDINATTTAVMFVASAASRNSGVGLDALTPRSVSAGLDEVVAALGDSSSALYAFTQLVGSLDQLAAESDTGHGVFVPSALGGQGSPLSQQWVNAVGVDLDEDGVVDATTDYFDDLLAQAAAEITFGVCYVPDVISVVWHLDMRQGVKNRNCSEVERFKWASDSDDKTVFLAGGVHEDTAVCGDGVSEHCLTQDQVDAVNQILGGWVPNKTPMHDDGSHGDAVAGDGVWTLALELPYIDPEVSGENKGVRLAYKFTFGLPGQGWTDSEEWPGNQRLLELIDVNGDGIVTRYDMFGDEAANKDKVNALKPALGGCGFIAWEAERTPDCAGDSRENKVDRDGDCEADTWDDPRPVVPVTEECP